ncbi:T9SS type A sorting domain-containing protein [Dyadobacter sp. CY347]|uniref:T9SS type A sorting domain-containing protein n=1 Tax=Dyadobacter sp. CY347 TaxID=2909336 RepID=UPI001F40C9D2|nr:T9SS type A sorting domain-containing protein [Dyadobacter sp. CY347]MCF2491459.1 T9SS type A sorting domain-containing protein [Dyadobacter sp. CY347]
MKVTKFLLAAFFCNAFIAKAQIGVQINSTTHLFANSYLRIDAQPLTFVNGHIITSRSAAQTTSVYFTDGTIIQGQSDARYVNGYVTKVGQAAFQFPVGDQDGNDIRPLEIISAAGQIELTIGYWKGDVGTNLDPTGGAHDRNEISDLGTAGVDKIESVSSLGFWDWVRGTKSAVVNIRVSMPDNTGSEGYPAANIRLVGWNTTTNQWENLSGGTAPTSNVEGTFVTGTITDMTKYSAITIGATSAPLPVTLISFTASTESGLGHLRWTTAEETNTDYFEIERSTNASDWNVIGRQAAAGDSKARLDYTFTDKAPMPGKNYYRLKMMDRDKTFAFSKIQIVNVGEAAEFLTMFPNPVSKTLYFKDIDLQKIEAVSINDRVGKQVFGSDKTFTGSINVSLLQNGLYIVRVRLSDGSSYIRKISVIH